MDLPSVSPRLSNRSGSGSSRIPARRRMPKRWSESPPPPKHPSAPEENLYTRHTFRPFLEKQACDIIQPDPQKCGGLRETKKIADMADLYYIIFACHNMCTPVGTYGSAQVCAATRNFVALESDSIEIPWWKDMIVNDGGPFYRNGYLAVPDKPGIGVELNEEVCRQPLAEGSRWFGR
jgi:L-alanine-DL-glutamate epimerase-like enolase superfamily enzyme